MPLGTILGTGVLVPLVAVVAVVGLWEPRLYAAEPSWTEARFLGDDLVTLLLALPVLTWSAARGLRGSPTGLLVWAGLLGYLVHDYASYVFGAGANALFLAHLAIVVVAAWSLGALLPVLRAHVVGDRLRRAPLRAVAVVLGATALVLGGLRTWSALRQVVTGEAPDGVPPHALDVLHALDLGLLVPVLLVAAVLAWRRTRWGAVVAGVAAVSGTAYLVGLASVQALHAERGFAASHVSVPGLLAVVLLAATSAVAARVVTAAWRP